MKYSISIVAYNHLEDTKECIESVLKNSGDFELLLWDNASTDGTKEYFKELAEEYPNITVTTSDENMGFLIPQNRNAQKSQGRFFVALNNDLIILCPDWLDKFSKLFDDPDIAIVGRGDESCTLDGTGQGHKGTRVDYIDGSCLMMRKDLIDKYGLFDEDNYKFAYSEDADLSLRMRSLGYKIAVTEVLMVHKGGVTAKSMSYDMMQKYSDDNRATLLKKWGVGGVFFSDYFEYKYVPKQERTLLAV